MGAPDDPWWPEAHHQQAESMVGKTFITLDELQDHAFCVRPELCERAAAFVHEAWQRCEQELVPGAFAGAARQSCHCAATDTCAHANVAAAGLAQAWVALQLERTCAGRHTAMVAWFLT